jgi:site-specific recombinase XerD
LALRYWDRKRKELENWPSDVDPLDEDSMFEIISGLGVDKDVYASRSHPDTLIETQQIARSLMREDGFVKKGGKEGFETLCELLRRTLLELTQQKQARMDGDYSIEALDTFFRSHNRNFERVTLQEAKELFWKDVIEPQNLAQKTIVKRAASFNMILQHFGHATFVHEVTRTECRAYRDLIDSLPPRFSSHFKGKPMVEVAEIAKQNNLESMAHNTCESYISQMGRFFNWLKNERHIPDNPAEGLTTRKSKIPNEETGHPYSLEQLQAIFNAPLYTGCVDDENNFAKKGSKVIKRSRYWLPLIALYTGFRMGEILQLEKSSVRHSKKETPYLLLFKDMRLKNPHSVREMPIHPDLVRMGFMELAERVNGTNDRLFATVRYRSAFVCQACSTLGRLMRWCKTHFSSVGE